MAKIAIIIDIITQIASFFRQGPLQSSFIVAAFPFFKQVNIVISGAVFIKSIFLYSHFFTLFLFKNGGLACYYHVSDFAKRFTRTINDDRRI